MRRPAALALATLLLSACVPPREHVDGRSSDGTTRVALDLRPAGGDSVRGTGTLQLAGKPRTVVLTGRWNEVGDGLRNLEATLQSDTTPDERWALEWSPVTLNGSIRSVDEVETSSSVHLATP